jgi:hypothetical protein
MRFDRAPLINAIEELGQEGASVGRGFGVVTDAEPTPEVEMAEHDSVGLERIGKGQHSMEGVKKRRRIDKLGADMAINADDFDPFEGRGMSVDRPRMVVCDPELVLE